jgi:hypothetical protein
MWSNDFFVVIFAILQHRFLEKHILSQIILWKTFTKKREKKNHQKSPQWPTTIISVLEIFYFHILTIAKVGLIIIQMITT